MKPKKSRSVRHYYFLLLGIFILPSLALLSSELITEAVLGWTDQTYINATARGVSFGALCGWILGWLVFKWLADREAGQAARA